MWSRRVCGICMGRDGEEVGRKCEGVVGRGTLDGSCAILVYIMTRRYL